MSDSFTETTSTSWFTRIKNALGGIVFGFVLLVASVIGLFWNEGRAVNTARALDEGAGQVVTIDAGAPGADTNGKLVHFTGPLTISGAPADPLFAAIKAPSNANQLVRKVEMYQWKESSRSETRKKLGGGEETVTTYSYAREWSSSAINSSNFKQPGGHENPPMAVSGESFSAQGATVGAVAIAPSRVAGLGTDTPVAVAQGDLANIAQALGTGQQVSLSSGYVYAGRSPTAPQLGDLRLSFETSSADVISAVGLLDGGKLDYFTASNGVKIGMIEAGEADAAQMFQAAQDANSTMTWIIRAVGLIAMLIGFKLIFSVIGVIGDIIPFVGDVFRFATGMAAMALTAVTGLLVIGTAWIYYRPLLGWSIIAIGAILAIGFFMLGKGRAKAGKAAEQELPA